MICLHLVVGFRDELVSLCVFVGRSCHMCVFEFIYIYRERERERGKEREIEAEKLDSILCDIG